MRANVGPELAYSQQRDHNVRILASLAEARHRRAQRREQFWLGAWMVVIAALLVWLSTAQGRAVMDWLDSVSLGGL